MVDDDESGARRPLGVFVGLATLDVVHRVERPPGANEKVTALRQDVAAGGPAANAAVTFAALGGRARLVTALGTDPVARVIRAELEARGVEVVDVTPDATTPPAISAVAVTDATGDRAVVSRDAAAHDVAGPPDLARHLAGADVVLLDGHHARLAAAAVAVAAAAPAGDAPLVVLDAGRWRPAMARLLRAVDVAVCSADFRAPGTTDVPASAIALLEAGVGSVATTHGGDAVQWWRPTAAGPAAHGSIPVPRIAAVDTLGAGDVFHGAFAWFVIQRPVDDEGADLRRALDAAARVAALRCTIAGPRAWLDVLTSGSFSAGFATGA
ncbi:PfkB family carbohydrate kinase [Pengzhenrongella sicca]|uniref:Kinase n=1 Tax=Pengzhenrongella sicca TaxID=2819238 RepID=A0A8A4ZEZ1_9MICO|nr:PfkB family carbohydrate kinase [Pengzhenrongella sicca]QTE29579.1 kinase [Pengzhenrongella sicca]